MTTFRAAPRQRQTRRMAKRNTEAPPRGGVVHPAGDPADEAARTFERAFTAPQPSFPLGGRRADPGAAIGAPPSLPSIAFDELTTVTPPDPATAFQWLDRGWRPVLGVVCGVGFFYSFVAAPVTDRREVDEAKLWVLCTLALGLAGAKTAERIGPGMIRPQGVGGPALVTR